MRGWRIKYVTTVDSATPATAVATVFAPVAPPKWAAPVVMWEHGTTGVMQKCMPSLSSAPALGIPALDRVVKAGWVIVATDYSFAEKDGPHPYLIGESEARAGLDSVRAARKMPELKLGSSTVVWGHSQGGQSALWTGIVGPRYAPDVRIAGVAAIAPATDMQKLLALNVALDKRLGSYLAVSYSRFYPDIRYEQAVNPRALWAAREIAKLCGFLPPEDPQRIGELAATFEGRVLAVGTNKALAVRMAQNVPNQPIAAPLLIAQGEDDAIVQPSVTDDYVSARCAAGQRLQYWKFTGADHGAIVQPGSKLDEKLIRWTTARFAGLPQAPGCPRRSF
jgi:pimeloyl-ACP methyl ester carboxylesterase